MKTACMLVMSSLFTVQLFAQTPTLTSVSPSFGTQGATMAVTLTGTNLTNTTAVATSGAGLSVNGSRVLSETQVEVLLVLNGPPGAKPLTVSVSGVNSNPVDFVVSPSQWQSSEIAVTDFAGPDGGAGSTDGDSTLAKFASPIGAWGDGTYLYVADSLNNVIRRVKISTGEVNTIAGEVGRLGSQDGTGANALFRTPHGIWGQQGSLYITDSGNYTVRKLDLATNTVTTVAGTPDERGTTNGQFARFVGPTGIWGDSTALYVADSLTSGARSIRKIALDSGVVTTPADLGSNGLFPIYGVGLWGDGTNLYIADSSRHVVRRMALTGGTIITIAGNDNTTGSGNANGLAATFNSPSAVWGIGETLYVTDTANFMVRAISIANSQVTTVSGQAGRAGWTDGADTVAQFGSPAGIWGVGSTVYVTERTNHAIRRVDLATGAAATLSGRPARLGAVDGGALGARFFVPSSIWGDSTYLYVADYFNATVRRVNQSNGDTSTIAGRAQVFGHLDAAGGSAVFGLLSGIWSNNNFVFVTDYLFDTIRRIDLTTRDVVTIAGNPFVASGYNEGAGPGARFRGPRGIWGQGDTLYVADSANFVIRTVTTAGVTALFAGVPGARGTIDGPGSSALFYQPADIWGDGANLYVLDGSAIRKISIATHEVTTLAGSIIGTGYAEGRSALFRDPLGLWGDGSSLFVADSGNHLVRKVDIASGLVSTVAGRFPTAGAENGRGPAARFLMNGDVWASGNNMYITDSWNHKLRRASNAVASVNPADITYRIGIRAGLTRATEGTDPNVRVGHARIVPDAGHTAPGGIAIFGFRQNGTLVSEAAVPASPLVLSGRIYAEVAGPVNTGVAISNTNSLPVTVSFYFTNSAGQNVNAGSTIIPANQQIATFLDQAPFATANFQGGFADIRSFTFTSTLPVAVVALRGFTNERSEFLLTTLPVIPLGAVGAGVLSFPHFADGGGWKTEVVLVNPTDSVISGTVQFLNQGTSTTPGEAIAITVNGTSGSSFNYSIPARSAFKLQTSNTDPATRSGWVRVTPGGGTRTPAGVVVFAFRPAGVTVSEAGVQALPSAPTLRLYTEAAGDFTASQPGSIQTGFAISNSSNANVTVNLELIHIDGRPTGLSGSIVAPANGQVARFLNQIPEFANLPVPFKGLLRIGGPSINVVGLRARFNEIGNLLITTTPPVDETAQPSVTDMIFPHFVDGGGYTTEFILFSAHVTQSPNGTLRFYGQNGQGMNIQLR